MMLRVAGDLPTIWLRNSKIQEISEPKPEQKYPSLMQKVMESSAWLQYQAEQSTSPPACNSIPVSLISGVSAPQNSQGLCMLSFILMDATKLGYKLKNHP